MRQLTSGGGVSEQRGSWTGKTPATATVPVAVPFPGGWGEVSSDHPETSMEGLWVEFHSQDALFAAPDPVRSIL